MRTNRFRISMILSSVLPMLLLADAASAQNFGPDFNGDGFADLAIGVPDRDLAALNEAGEVHVLYGTPDGLTTENSQVWTQNSPGVLGNSEVFDLFGAALAWGDFNGDGFDDLAIGSFYESVGNVEGAGAVNVLYGSPAGLTADGNQFWYQSNMHTPDVSEFGDNFGAALAAGDFNGDGIADLAIGAPHETLGIAVEAGAVDILYGSVTGLTNEHSQFWNQNSAGIQNFALPLDHFGETLATGDFNHDGFDDLAVGVPGEHNFGRADSGAVQILYGSSQGLRAAGNQYWRQSLARLHSITEAADMFGASLAVGDFNGDGVDDLAIGAPGEKQGGVVGAGAVSILFGSNNGLKAAGNQFLAAGIAGLHNSLEENDMFGWRLAAGDFNGDGFSDLAISVPNRTIDGVEGAGAVQIMYGSPHGLKIAGNRLFKQTSTGVTEDPNLGDGFGYSIACRDFNGDGFTDLAVGVPFEDIFDIVDAGVVHIFFGSPTGVHTADNQFFSQNTPGIGELPQPNAEFGDFF